jgi:integrase
MSERLTDRRITALKPENGSRLYFDSEVSGLAVRVYPTGRKAFVFDWRDDVGRQRRVTIGRFPAWTIGKARDHAGRLRLRVDVGESVAPRRGARVEDLVEQWRGIVDLTRRPRTASSYDRLVRRYVVPRFGRLDPRAISRNAVEQWHGGIAARAPIEANRALATLSAFCSWLERDRVIERNPCRGVRRRPENERHVFLDAGEIAAAHGALDALANRRAALVLQLCLHSGCRLGEALNLTAEQIDGNRRLWIKLAASTKQRKLHIAPLAPAALAAAQELLRLGPSDYDACRRAWERVRALIGRPDVRIHDLRHTRASALARNGATLLQIGRLLGHTTPATTARYTHLVSQDLVDLVERT